MGYEGDKKREYQRDWLSKRRAEGIKLLGGKCVVCGSTEKLEVDHIDAKSKVDHRIWSWSDERRKKELAKCQLLCQKHHGVKTTKTEVLRGEQLPGTKLNEQTVRKIRQEFEGGKITKTELAKKYGINKQSVDDIIKRKTWKHI